MPADVKITTELLYKGALVFALLDAIYIPLLLWRVSTETFRRLKWSLVIAAALVWYVIWSWAIGNFWETVYSYVFPGLDVGTVDRIYRRRCHCACLVDVVASTSGEGCSRLLSLARLGESDPPLGCLSRHRHQTNYVAGRLSTGSGRHRVFRVHILLVYDSRRRKDHGLDANEVEKQVSTLMGLESVEDDVGLRKKYSS
jgi:hypothetical protein